MNSLTWLATSDVGDPDTWPEAVTYLGLFAAALGVYFVWARWGGGARERERERRRDEERDGG